MGKSTFRGHGYIFRPAFSRNHHSSSTFWDSRGGGQYFNYYLPGFACIDLAVLVTYRIYASLYGLYASLSHDSFPFWQCDHSIWGEKVLAALNHQVPTSSTRGARPLALKQEFPGPCLPVCLLSPPEITPMHVQCEKPTGGTGFRFGLLVGFRVRGLGFREFGLFRPN